MGSATVQADLWGRHATTWSTEIEVQMQALYDATLTALEPLAGTPLLDAGCGAGLAASRARARGARVAGVDATDALLDVARARTPDGDFRVGDIEQLPHADGAFDVVTAFNAVQYATSPLGAVAELARVCRPGGRVAIGVWGEPSRCETDGLFARLRSLAPPPPGTPAPLAISEPGRVESLLEGAGLTVEAGGEVSCPLVFRDLDHAWAAHSSAGPVQHMIDAVGAEAVRTTFDRVLEADRKPDGQLRQDNVFRYVIARKS